MNHDHVMDDINEMLGGAEPPTASECCIYKVPFVIRNLNEDAYTPRFVSIGPFHYRNPRLQNMQRHKIRYCNKFLERARPTLHLDTLVRHIEEAEPSVRRCYSGTLDLTLEELVKVVLVDSGFIIELFWRHFYGDWSDDDKLLWKPWLTTSTRLDLLLLENQLPFFVLEGIFNHSGVGGGHSFLQLAFDYFKHYNSSKLLPSDNASIKHFTDLLRTFHLKPLGAPPFGKDRTGESKIHLQSATELLEAGVAFEVNTGSKCLMDLRFSGGVLKIPQFRVEDWTETLFRNMIALEQCHYPYESYFTDYVAVLDFLINTSRDVDVLVSKGILVHWLGDSDSVAKLFNGLWKNITYADFSNHYFQLCRDLDAFYTNFWHNLKATLRRDFGRTPWQAAASIAGIVLLFLSLIQSVCSVIQVVQQAKQSNN